MQGFNHVAGGLAFTGIFASFADVNLFARPEYLGACVFFSLLADVDHTSSIIGKVFYPVSKWLYIHHGHRTVTHSLPFYFALILVIGITERLITGGRGFTAIAALAYGSHLLFDMCTRQGVPLFLPFTRARCVLPGNPSLRLSSSSPVAEICVFVGFCLLLLTTYPLMQHGFLSTVNNTLADFTRVLDEHTHHRDILELETTEGAHGQVVAATETGAVLFDGKRFIRVDDMHNHPKKFHHTGKLRKNERLEFVEITGDSLRRILQQPVIAVKATASAPIRYRVAGQQYEQSSLALEFPTGFDFSEVKADNTSSLSQIARLRASIQASAKAQQQFVTEQQVKRAKVAELHKAYPTLSAWEQGKASDQIQQLTAELAAAKPPEVSPDVLLASSEITRIKKALTAQKHTFTGVATIWKP
jgi:inner membrane protein